MIFMVLSAWIHLAHAAPTCEAVQGLEKGSVICGSRETELFLKDQEKVSGLKLVLEDKESGRVREVYVGGLRLKMSQVKNKEFLVSPAVKKILLSVQKSWGVAPSVVVQALEFASQTHFYSAQDYKLEVKTNLAGNEKRSLASSSQPTLQGAGVMRALKKK